MNRLNEIRKQIKDLEYDLINTGIAYNRGYRIRDGDINIEMFEGHRMAVRKIQEQIEELRQEEEDYYRR